MAPPRFYVLECTVTGVTAEFYVNDVPVIRRGPDLGVYFAGPVNHLVFDDLNELAVVVEPGPRPSEALCGAGGRRERKVARVPVACARMGASEDDPPEDSGILPEAKASLWSYPRGAVVGSPSGKLLLEVRWEGDPGYPAFFPLVAAGQVNLGPVHGPCPWEEAQRLEGIDDPLEQEVRALLQEVRDALQAGDPEPFLARSQPRLQALERAYALLPGEKERQIRQGTAQDVATPSWAGMEPLRELDLRLCGQRRLVECIAPDWLPAVREKDRGKDGFGTYAMFLAKLDGRWAVVA